MNRSILNTPLMDAEDAAPGTIGAAQPVAYAPPGQNVAEDPSILRQIQDLHEVIEHTRSSRQGLNDEWLSILTMEMQLHDSGRRYKGHSDAYIPLYTRILQTLVSNMASGLFPSGEYLDVTTWNDEVGAAMAAKKYLIWEFERVAKLNRVLKRFLRPFAGWGIGVLKYRYKKEASHAGKRRGGTLKDILAAAAAGGNQEAGRLVDEGLHVSARNPLYWYIYPPTADTLDDAQIIFEDINVPYTYVEQKLRSGDWLNAENALIGTTSPDAEMTEQEILGMFALSSDQGSFASNNAQGGRRRVTEAYCYLVFPRNQYTAHENPELAVPAHVILVDDVPVRVTRNPQYSQRPPYEVSVQNATPGSFYGYGAGRLIRSLQYLTNDFTNQTNDAGMYGLNPIVLTNPAYLAGPLTPLRPGVVWQVTDVNQAVKFDRPAIEMVQYGLQLSNQFQQTAQEYGGAPPILQGVGSGRGAKTATGSQILQRNAMTPLQDVIEDLETDIMVPMMQNTWMLAQQYRSADAMFRVAGQDMKLSPEQLNHDPDFRWLASNQAVNRSQRAQQAMTFIQVLQPLIPLLQQTGKSVDFARLLERIWGDGFGFTDFDKIITDLQPSPMPGAPAGAPGMPGAEDGDRVRSATEQTDGGGGEMVAGEGEDFMAVRNEADDIAAMLGGMNQGG